MKPVPGGSYGRSILGGGGKVGEASTIRLLKALQSNAPGGWSDDRYEQTLRHFVGITYVGIHRISQQLGRSTVKVFREDPDHPDGKRPIHYSEKAYELTQLLKRPNPHDTWGKLMYRISLQKRLTGSALLWAPPNLFDEPYQLYVIPTALAIPQTVMNPEYPQGFYRIQPVYPYGPFSSFPSPASSVGAPIPGEQILKIQYPHPLLQYEGYSPLTGMRAHIDAIEMIDRTRHYMMRRGVAPSAVLNGTDAEGAQELDDDALEQIKASFESDHMGPENMGRLFVAYAGWKLEQWGHTPDAMAFEGGWDQLSGFILGGGFGITKPAAGMVEDSTYQTLFATMKQLHLQTLEPETEDVGAELTRFFRPHYGEDILVEVECPRIDDHEVKFSKLGVAMQGFCMTKNELRHELEMPLTREPWGAEIAGVAPAPPPMPGMMGDPNDPLAMMMGAAGGMEGDAPEEDAGELAEGSLGPQMGGKSLRKHKRRLFSTAATTNGNGRH